MQIKILQYFLTLNPNQTVTTKAIVSPSDVPDERGLIIRQNLAAFEALHSRIKDDYTMENYPGSLKLADISFYTYDREALFHEILENIIIATASN